MSEQAAAWQFIMQQCGADAPGGVFFGSADPSVGNTLHITANPYGGSDSTGVAMTRLLTRQQWLIEAWGPKAQMGDVDAIATALDSHLQSQKHVNVPSGHINSAWRIQSRFAEQPVPGAEPWVRIGGVYQIDVSG